MPSVELTRGVQSWHSLLQTKAGRQNGRSVVLSLDHQPCTEGDGGSGGSLLSPGPRIGDFHNVSLLGNQRARFSCSAQCAEQEPQLEKSMSYFSQWPSNYSGMDMVDLLDSFCDAKRSCTDGFVMVVLFGGDVHVKGCKAELNDEELYLIGPEDLSLVIITMLGIQKIAPLPSGPVAFGMHLSDYTCLLDRHNVGPGVPIFSYLGRDTSWAIPWPSTFTMASAMEASELKNNGPADGTTELVPWPQKKSLAYWVGAVTGPWEFLADSALDSVPRVQLLELSHKYPKLLKAQWTSVASYGLSWINDANGSVAGANSPRERTIEEITGVPMSSYAAPRKWAGYKYYVNIDGVVLGGRASKLLGFGGVMLQQDAGYQEYLSARLEANKHYVPIKYDLSDLIEKIQWLQKNDDKARSIAQAGRELAAKRMRFQDAICYQWRALEALGSRTSANSPKHDTKDILGTLAIRGFKKASIRETMEKTLQAFWDKPLDKVAVGERLMSKRGAKMLQFVWDQLDDLHRKVSS